VPPGDTPAAPGPSLPPHPGAEAAGREVSGSAPPQPTTGRGRVAGLSGYWGTLVSVRRVLGPRRAPGARPITAPRHGPSVRSDGGRATRSLLSGLASTAFALAVYASPTRSPGPTQDALLAVGQLYQVGLVTHRIPLKGFRLLFLLSQPIRTQERPSSAAGPAGKKSCREKPFCRPRLLQRLDTHHGLFASGILEVLSDKYPLTRRP
jgi:hypothetical protein